MQDRFTQGNGGYSQRKMEKGKKVSTVTHMQMQVSLYVQYPSPCIAPRSLRGTVTIYLQ